MAVVHGLGADICREGSARWAPAALLLCGFLAGPASPRPAAARTDAWERLLSRSALGLPPSGPRSEPAAWETDCLLGIKRVRRLYCNVGIGFHLQVLPDGAVGGVHEESESSLIEISTVERGVVSLYGLSSGLFVAMNARGRLYATAVFQDECKFKETLLPNNYNAYESSVYKGFFIALSKHGRAKRGNKATAATTVVHFLPRL